MFVLDTDVVSELRTVKAGKAHRKARVKAATLDRKFDNGEKITDLLDLSQARRPGVAAKRVNVDFPEWMVQSIDREARRLGVTRQSLIKMWLADRLQQAQH